MIIKTKDLFYKNGYELRSITELRASELEIGNQVYLKEQGVAIAVKIIKCFENAKKFEVVKI